MSAPWDTCFTNEASCAHCSKRFAEHHPVTHRCPVKLDVVPRLRAVADMDEFSNKERNAPPMWVVRLGREAADEITELRRIVAHLVTYAPKHDHHFTFDFWLRRARERVDINKVEIET